MIRCFILFLILLIGVSCNTGQKDHTIQTADAGSTTTTLHETILADLPDSLQPRIVALDTMPKPDVYEVPGQAVDAHNLINPFKQREIRKLEPPKITVIPCLRTETGSPILDSFGKPIHIQPGYFQFTNYSTTNGMAMDNVLSAYADSKGNIWFATDGMGVSRFDGRTFTTISVENGLAGNSVLSITEDKAGNIWFGTGGEGVSRFDGISYTTFTTTNGLANNSVHCILTDRNGVVWFGTDEGVSRFDGKILSRHGLPGEPIYSIAEDHAGNLWFGKYAEGVSRFDGKSYTNFSISDGLPNAMIHSITVDQHGNVWFGTFGGGACRYDGRIFTTFSTKHGLVSNEVKCMLCDRSGNIWIGTTSGVSCYTGSTFVHYTKPEEVGDARTYAIVQDKEGGIWCCTRSNGVSRFDGPWFTNIKSRDGLGANSILSILEEKPENGNEGTMWFGTMFGGVSKFDGKEFTVYSMSQGLKAKSVSSMIKDKKGKLWFGTWGGLSCFDGKRFTNYDNLQWNGLNFTSSIVMCILEDSEGVLWIGTTGGLIRFDGKTCTTYTMKQGLAGNFVSDIIEDAAHNLWIASDDRGVSRFDGHSFVNFNKANGLADDAITSVNKDKAGNLWFATNFGISLLSVEKQASVANHKNKFSSSSFKTFSTTDGLPTNRTTGIIQLPDNRYALSSSGGLAIFTLSKDLNNISDLEIFNEKTGYPVKDINSHALVCDRHGMIWAGSTSQKTGLIKFDYSAFKKTKEPPQVVIKDVLINDDIINWYDLQQPPTDSTLRMRQEFSCYGRSLTPSERDSMHKKYKDISFDSITPFYPIPQHLKLPYTNNKISFDYVALVTARNFMVRYKYILEGYSTNWSPETDKTSADFERIPEGTYTFKLMAKSPQGIWSKPVSFTFTILPPWYRTWWSYGIYLLSFILGLAGFVTWRERRLRVEKEKLEQTVAERTAELVAEKKVVEQEKHRSDELLLNILPEEVAEQLKQYGSTKAKSFSEVTVMFTDFKDFTQLAERLTPTELVEEIHTCFKAFDEIITKYHIEKIKTIGDAYMCAGGLPVENDTHAMDVVHAAIEIQAFMERHLEERRRANKAVFEIRIGVHTGPVVAGIVGVKKFAYDIWGDTVNTASRMEGSGEAGKINISGTTHALVKDQIACTYRGKIQAKGKGEIDMYFVNSSFSEG